MFSSNFFLILLDPSFSIQIFFSEEMKHWHAIDNLLFVFLKSLLILYPTKHCKEAFMTLRFHAFSLNFNAGCISFAQRKEKKFFSIQTSQNIDPAALCASLCLSCVHCLPLLSCATSPPNVSFISNERSDIKIRWVFDLSTSSELHIVCTLVGEMLTF